MINQSKWVIFLKAFGIVGLIINLVYLNFHVLDKNDLQEDSNDFIRQQSSGADTFSKPSSVDYSELQKTIKEATAALTLRVDSLSSETQLPDDSSIQTTKNFVSEYYIPLGSGSTSSSDWVDLTGVEAYVTPSNYGDIDEMYFEAALRIPTGTGRAYARLKNVTDNTSLFESEVSLEGTVGGLVSSGKIPVPRSTKLYRVQLKSSLGAQVVLDNARIKLFVN